MSEIKPEPASGIEHQLLSPPSLSLPRQITSSELLQNETELLIRHGEETYRLKLTRNGKLILQK